MAGGVSFRRRCGVRGPHRVRCRLRPGGEGRGGLRLRLPSRRRRAGSLSGLFVHRKPRASLLLRPPPQGSGHQHPIRAGSLGLDGPGRTAPTDPVRGPGGGGKRGRSDRHPAPHESLPGGILRLRRHLSADHLDPGGGPDPRAVENAPFPPDGRAGGPSGLGGGREGQHGARGLDLARDAPLVPTEAPWGSARRDRRLRRHAGPDGGTPVSRRSGGLPLQCPGCPPSPGKSLPLHEQAPSPGSVSGVRVGAEARRGAHHPPLAFADARPGADDPAVVPGQEGPAGRAHSGRGHRTGRGFPRGRGTFPRLRPLSGLSQLPLPDPARPGRSPRHPVRETDPPGGSGPPEPPVACPSIDPRLCAPDVGTCPGSGGPGNRLLPQRSRAGNGPGRRIHRPGRRIPPHRLPSGGGRIGAEGRSGQRRGQDFPDSPGQRRGGGVVAGAESPGLSFRSSGRQGTGGPADRAALRRLLRAGAGFHRGDGESAGGPVRSVPGD